MELHRDLDILAERPPQHVIQARNQPIQVDRLRRQNLLAREREQTLRQGRRLLRRLKRALDGAAPSERLRIERHVEMADDAEAPSPEMPAHATPRGGETILVVEDDAAVRSLVVQQLSDLGYHVLEAADGATAQETLKSDVEIDLLFTDVVMPGGVTGRKLAEEAQRSRPGLRTLFTSGYTENSIVHQGRLDAGVQLLSKPYKKQDLARKVREVLDGPAMAQPLNPAEGRS